jgi:signal peptidase II
MKKIVFVTSICAFFVLLDQVTKYLIITNIPLYGKISLLPFLDIVHIRNTGVAFGFLSNLPESFRFYFFVLVFLLALALVSIFLYKTPYKEKLMMVSLSLILSGAIGNSIDRLRLGYVTDFIDFHWFGDPKLHWPPFNAADSCITIGVILLILHSLFLNKDKAGS